MTGTFAARDASLMTVHLCSTVPMGGDGRGAADGCGRLHGTANVYVNDVAAPRRPRRQPAGR